MNDINNKNTYYTYNYQKTIWMDVRLAEKTMDHLWDIIDNSSRENARKTLRENITDSFYLQDKENFFYENVLRGCTEYMYFREWENYYDIVVSNSRPLPSFQLQTLWANYMKKHEFTPPHNHDNLMSFVVFMKIPTHWKEQHANPEWNNAPLTPCASNFSFMHPTINFKSSQILLSSTDEGRMLFFPAWLLHQVFPFYGTEEERITISGNIALKNDRLDLMADVATRLIDVTD